jgi:hypothetical protein
MVEDGEWFAIRSPLVKSETPFEVFGISREIVTLSSKSGKTLWRGEYALKLVSPWAKENWPNSEAQYIKTRRDMLDILTGQIEKACRGSATPGSNSLTGVN